jgi:hypothetical protein
MQNIMTFASFSLTAIAIFLLGYIQFVPAWAVFITWACFFHMDGGANKKQGFMSTITHLWLGALGAWITALFLLNSPFHSAAANTLWGPIVIGAAVATLARMSTIPRFSVTPAIIYGYASLFAFTSTPGTFSIEKLLSISFENALISIWVAVILGALCGYSNVVLIERLMELSAKWQSWRKGLVEKQTKVIGN